MSSNSITVLISLLRKINKHEGKEIVIEEITKTLVEHGVCTEEEVEVTKEQWETFIKDVLKKVNRGCSYDRAYRSVMKKYPQFSLMFN